MISSLSKLLQHSMPQAFKTGGATPFQSPQGRPFQAIQSIALGATLTCWAILTPRPSLGAEAINVTLKSISFDIPLADLELLANEGQVAASLGFVKAASKPGQIESLQALLQTRFDLPTTVISQFLALPEGDVLLARLGSLIALGKPNQGNHAHSNSLEQADLLRETILTASVHPDGLNLINLVRQYPQDRLVLDVSQALALISENSDFYIRRPEIIQTIQDQANRDRLPSTRSFQDLTQAGPHDWQRQPIAFRTPSRASFSFADLYLPKRPSATNGNGKTPVVLLSHGLGSNRHTLAYLAEHWASHGYAAVVIEHNATSSDRFNRFLRGMAAPPAASELLQRPQDVTAVLDQLSQRAKTDPKFASLNLESVGIAGQSMGGYTALAVGGAQINRPQLEEYCPEELNRFTLNISIPIQCRVLDLPAEASLETRDERIKAVLAVNPLTSQIFGQAGLAQLDVPVMMVAGSNDYIAPALPEQLQPFPWIKSPEKYLLLVNQGTHFSFIGDDGSSEVLELPEIALGPSGALAQPGLQAMGLAFFNRHLRGEADYSNYLNQNYADSLTRSPISYSLVQTLPEAINPTLKTVSIPNEF